MQSPGRKRVTPDDYEAFLSALCGMPPGSEREECARDLTRKLLKMYADYGLTAPPGLVELAQRTGVTAPPTVR